MSELRDIEHVRICGGEGVWCGHPRQHGIGYFGGGEIAVMHAHQPACRYESWDDLEHDKVHPRCHILLQRSTDGGHTWPAKDNVVVFDESAPLAERRAWLTPRPNSSRPELDMSHPDAMFYWGRTWSGDPVEGKPPRRQSCFVLRSTDRGQTWEDAPLLIDNPFKAGALIHRDNHPLVRMPDGSWLGALSAWPGAVVLFGSDDDGLTWEYLAAIARDPTGLTNGRPTYAGLVLLPTGRLLCVTVHIDGQRNCMQMNYSDDGGYSWSEPKPIVAWGRSPWRRHRQRGQSGGSVFYRSPWPMLLKDGRLLVIFARRKPPFGIGCIVSEDNGATWSDEKIVRCDAEHHDLGYPVATQLDDGRIFTAYYYNIPSEPTPMGARRHIAGSLFLLS